jgi:hypothetical protein
MQEMKIHRDIDAGWSNISLDLDAIPNYAGGEGCPDEILTIRLKIPFMGKDIEISVPVLIELEKAGSNAADRDLVKFCERSINDEQNSFLDIPMIVIGGDSNRFIGIEKKPLKARFTINQVPRRMVL